MSVELVGVLGRWLTIEEALIVIGAWTVSAAFLGRLVLRWATTVVLRHAAVSVSLGIVSLAIEQFYPGGIGGAVETAVEIVGIGGILG